MLIVKYFKPVCKKEKDFALPDPSGPLSKRVPSSSIEAANKKVSELLANPLQSSSEQEQVHPSKSKTKRKPYLILDPAQRYEFGKRAAENGIAASLRYYARKYPELALKETTVRRLKNLYQLQLSTPSKSQGGSSDSCTLQEVPSLPHKKVEDRCCLERSWIRRFKNISST